RSRWRRPDAIVLLLAAVSSVSAAAAGAQAPAARRQTLEVGSADPSPTPITRETREGRCRSVRYRLTIDRSGDTKARVGLGGGVAPLILRQSGRLRLRAACGDDAWVVGHNLRTSDRLDLAATTDSDAIDIIRRNIEGGAPTVALDSDGTCVAVAGVVDGVRRDM